MANCNEEGCDVLTSGKCINNLEIDTCPHYSNSEESVNNQLLTFAEDDLRSVEKSDIALNLVSVFSGKALTLAEVNRVSSMDLTRLIILAGPPDVGKTTILLSLMHLFQTHTSFEGFLFAGSETLIDFEEKSHPSKIASEKNNEETNRTPIEPPKFLHLKVAEMDNIRNTTNLLFTDISGELFVAIRDSTVEAKKFTLCKRADHFAIFFDADRITTIKERANAKSSGLGILRSLFEAGSLLRHTCIQIIFSRWDLFSGKPNQENHNEFISLLKSDIISQFGETFHISFFEISARPKKGLLQFGYGISEIFPVWVKKSILDNNHLKKDIELTADGAANQYLTYKFNK